MKKLTAVLLCIALLVGIMPISAFGITPKKTVINFDDGYKVNQVYDAKTNVQKADTSSFTDSTNYGYSLYSYLGSAVSSVNDKNGASTNTLRFGVGNKNTWGASGSCPLYDGTDFVRLVNGKTYNVKYDVMVEYGKGTAPLGDMVVSLGISPTFTDKKSSDGLYYYDRIAGAATRLNNSGVLFSKDQKEFTYYVNNVAKTGVQKQWYTCEDTFTANIPAKSDTMPLNDVLCFAGSAFGEAVWVYFDNVEITEVNPITFVYGNNGKYFANGEDGTEIAYPQVPERENYTFEGWYNADGTRFKDTVFGDRNFGKTVYAAYTPTALSQTVTFDEAEGNYPDKLWYANSYEGVIYDTVDSYGWSTTKYMGDGTLLVENTKTWGQPSIFLLKDNGTNNMLTLEYGCTYKMTVTYKMKSIPSGNTSAIYVGTSLSKAAADDSIQDTRLGVSVLLSEEKEKSNDWKTASGIFSTPEAGSDGIPCAAIYTSLSKTSSFLIDTVTVEKVTNLPVNSKGASVLTDEAVAKAGSQALRAYFGYELDANGKVDVNGEKHSVIARGMLYKDKENKTDMAYNNFNKGGVTGFVNYLNLDKYWAKEGNTVIYSAYFKGFKVNDAREIAIRGFLQLDDGSYVYSDVKYFSVASVTEKTDKRNTGTQREKIAIMLVIGQSNAEGAGYSESSQAVEATNGKYVMAEKPTSVERGRVYYNLSRTGGINVLDAEHDLYNLIENGVTRVGGFAPAYANAWYEQTGEKVAVVQVSLGATNLAEWAKNPTEQNFKEYKTGAEGGQFWLYSNAVSYWNETYKALSEQYQISHAFYMWNQGEGNEQRTDPELYTIYSDETYEKYYQMMHDNLMEDCIGLQFGTIVMVRSCRENSVGVYNSGNTTVARRAQYALANKNDNLYIVSYKTEECNKKVSWVDGKTVFNDSTVDLVPSVSGCSYAFSNMHFTQWRYNQIGAEAGINLYKLLNNCGTFTGVGIYDISHNTLAKFGVNGEGSLKVTEKPETEYLQIRVEDESCDYTFSLSVNTDLKQLVIDVYTDGVARETGDTYINRYGKINWNELNKLGITELDTKVNIH